ncbi:MAG: FkbM family methyltransferase [Acidisphaera sp.]|nr:FkbM family methyltransferase [Acidisphaera sp.]
MLHRSDLEDDIAAYLVDRLPSARIKTVFDVGANIGWFSYQFLRAYPECNCYLFEPVTSNFERIRPNLVGLEGLNANGRIKCFKLGLGLTAERQKITALPNVTINQIMAEIPDGTPFEEIEIVTGDAFCKSAEIEAIDFLKIDAEGYDMKVLLGFSQMLLRGQIDFVQVEAGISRENTLHVPLDAFDAVLSSFGYRKFRFTNQASHAVPVLTWADVVFINQNTAQRLASS